MPKYLISYRKTEEAGQKPEWASFTTQSEAALEAHAIRERVDKRMSVLGEQLWGDGEVGLGRQRPARRRALQARGGRAGDVDRLRAGRGVAARMRAAEARPTSRKILIIGSGPIVIGQACEFDYSGTQACKALREEGFEVVLVNSNPATIMTDPEMADRTYVEPLTPEFVEQDHRARAARTRSCPPWAGRPRSTSPWPWPSAARSSASASS